METLGLILIGAAKPSSTWLLYPGTLFIAVAGIMGTASLKIIFKNFKGFLWEIPSHGKSQSRRFLAHWIPAESVEFKKRKSEN